MATINSLTLKATPLTTDTIELNDGQKATLLSLPLTTAGAADATAKANAAQAAAIAAVTWTTLPNKPAVIAAGADADEAREVIEAQPLSPALSAYADAASEIFARTDAEIRAANIALGAIGGGLVRIASGVINISAPIVPQPGVTFVGSGCGFDTLDNTHSNVGTILSGDGTFNCFEYNPTDNPDPTGSGNLLPMDNTLKGAGITNLTITNFRNGIKFGALNRSGVHPLNISRVVVTLCAEWGVYLENCAAGQVMSVACLRNVVGQFHYASSTPNWNFGNTVIQNLFCQPPGNRTSKGTCIYSKNDSTLNQVTLIDLESFSGAVATTPVACTITSGSANIAVSNVENYIADSPVIFGSTVGNISANQIYFVTSKSGTTGAGTIQIGTHLGAVGGQLITPNASGTPTIVARGMANVEIAGRGNNSITALSIFGADMEVAGNVDLVLQRVYYGTIVPTYFSGAPVAICARDCNQGVNLVCTFNLTGTDFDIASRNMFFTGIRATNVYNSGTGVGINYNRSKSRPELSLQGYASPASLYESSSGIFLGTEKSFLLAHSSIFTGQSVGSKYANVLVYETTASGSSTLPAISDSTLGYALVLSNPQASGVNWTINTSSSQTINNISGTTSFVVSGQTQRTATACKVGSTFYWAVSA